MKQNRCPLQRSACCRSLGVYVISHESQEAAVVHSPEEARTSEQIEDVLAVVRACNRRVAELEAELTAADKAATRGKLEWEFGQMDGVHPLVPSTEYSSVNTTS